MKNKLGEVRRSQLITTHGPGAILDFRAGGYGGAGISVVGAGLEEWDVSAGPPGLGHPQTVYEPRLQKKLGVAGFRLPPVAPQTSPGQYSRRAGKLIGARFPHWLQCPECHVIRQSGRWAEDAGDPALYCSTCSREAGGSNRKHVVPVRFISICENGHLDEFPWHWWLGHKDNCSRSKDLKLEGSATAGLSGLILKCTECEEERSMEGSFSDKSIGTKCSGRRPWLGGEEVSEPTCGAIPRVVQRGASNIYFSVVDSALAIPPWSDQLQRKLGIHWSGLANASSTEVRRGLLVSLNEALRLTSTLGKSLDEICEQIEDRVLRLQDGTKNIRWDEYQQFIRHSKPFGENTEFEIRPEITPPELATWISKVVRATRIREVRALTGFTRVLPFMAGDDARLAKLSIDKLNWLPAVENKGEGIFLELHPESLKAWESLPAVRRRAEKLNSQYQKWWLDRGKPAPEAVTARLLLVHSLAHALIRQLSLTCGYNSASLRERLYVGDNEWEMAGLLIFTSSPDADGTLGGLVRQGLPKNIVHTFKDTLTSMAWCSSDPLCIEDIHAVSSAGSGAACHSCLLAAETSCERFNGLLDRALLVGTPSEPELGFFSSLLEEYRSEG